MTRKKYVTIRLMELAFIADVRPLDDIEKKEEKKLIEELASYEEVDK